MSAENGGHAIVLDDNRGDYPSASSMERILLCPGSHRASLKARRDGTERRLDADDEMAARGERIHAVVTGMTSEDALSDDTETAMVKWIREREQEALDAANINPTESEILREVRIWIRAEDFAPIASARVDTVYIAPCRTKALIADYKTGYLAATPAEQNWQLRTQAVALVQEYPSLQEVFCVLIEGGIRQVSAVRYQPSDLLLARELIVSACRLAMQEGNIRIPGVKQCRYCPAASTCTESQGFFATIGSTDIQTISEPERMAAMLDVCLVAEARIDAIRKRAKEMIESGCRITNGDIEWVLSPGTQRRKITDVPEACSRLARQGVTYDQFLSCCSVRITDLEAVYRRTTGLKGPRVKDALQEALVGVIEVTTAAPSLSKITCKPELQEQSNES